LNFWLDVGKMKLNNILNKEVLYKLYITNKLTTRQISVLYNTTHVTILSYLKKYNIDIRNRNKCHIGYKYSEASKKKMSDSHKGKTPWNKNKKMSKEYGEQIRQRNLSFNWYRETAPNWKGGNPKCDICKKELSCRIAIRCNKCRVGINHHCYIHGQYLFPYPLKFNKSLKKEIRERDNFKCQCCKITEKQHLKKLNQVLIVHHIDYNKNNCDKDNLITVCLKCNTIANSNRDYWYAYYKYVMNSKEI
jgi:hypothetical protein